MSWNIDKERLLKLIDEAELVQIDHGDGPKGWVYFIICADLPRCKIGFTKGGVHKRLKNLQTGSSSELIMLAAHPGTPKTERLLHERFAEHSIHGEWFELTDEIRAYMINTLWAMSEIAVKMGGKLSPWMAAGVLLTAEQLGFCSEGLLEAMGVEE